MKRKCKYRSCNALLSDEVHGNAEYCPANAGEQNKMSCKAKEEKLKCKERDQQKALQYEKQMLLKASLHSLFNDKAKEYVSEAFFRKHIEPAITLFKKDTLTIGESKIVAYAFDNYRMYKELKDDEYQICIEKQISYE